MTRTPLIFAGLVLCASCDSLVEQTYRGEPIATLRAVVANESGATPERPRAAVFWARDLALPDYDELVEQVSTSQPVRDGDFYTLNLFEEPALLLPWDARDPDGPKFAVGRLLIYEDENDNARHDQGEPLAGGLLPYVIVYAPQTLPAHVGPSRLQVPKGLHFSWAPLPCAPDPMPNDDTCGAPLGDACMVGQPCGAGECVDRFTFPWPRGACLVRVGGCVPGEGALLAGEGGGYFAAACESDDDCARPSPYRCDPLQGACVPFNVPRMAIMDLPPSGVPFCTSLTMPSPPSM